MTDGPLLWYVNRSTGIVLLVLLTVVTVLGILSTGGRPGGLVPRFVPQMLHRNIALLSVSLLLVHVVSAVADTFVDIRWWQALLPFGATYQPLWLGLGTASLDLMAVVVLTSLARTRLSHRSWRAVHLLAYLAWAMSVAHGIGIGTDMSTGTAWGLPLALACVAVVGAAGLARAGTVLARPHRPRSHQGGLS